MNFNVNRSFTRTAMALILAAVLASTNLSAAAAQPPVWKRAWNTTKNIAGGAVNFGTSYLNFLKGRVKKSASKVNAGMVKTSELVCNAHDKIIEKCSVPKFCQMASIGLTSAAALTGALVGFGFNKITDLTINAHALFNGAYIALLFLNYKLIQALLPREIQQSIS